MISLDKKRAPGYYFRGLALQGENKLDDSNTVFEQSLQITPNAAEPLIGLAKNKMAQGEIDQDLERVQLVINETPEHYLAWNLKGEILLTHKQFVKAAESLGQAIKIQPKWMVPYRNLAKIHLFNQDAEAALYEMKRGFEASDSAELGVDYARLLQRQNHKDKARSVYETILKKRPGMTTARNNYAMLLIDAEAPDRKTLDRALELVTPLKLTDNPLFIDTVGWVHFKRNELSDAVMMLEQAVGLIGDRQMPEIKYHLAEAYAALEREPEAIQLLETVVASNSDFSGKSRAKELLEKIR